MHAINSTIYDRGRYYKAGSYRQVYHLYSVRSELRKHFTECDIYVSHVELLQSAVSEFIDTLIVNSRVRGSLAEVNFIEIFNECEDNGVATEVKYHTKSVLVLEDGVWKILREERSRVVVQ